MPDDPLKERQRRWRLAVGDETGSGGAVALSERDKRIDHALSALYGSGDSEGKKRGGLGASSPRVARWLGDVREFFPASVVQVIQKDAFQRLGLKQMLLEPELLSVMEADVHLVADLISLGSAIPAKTKETARLVVRKVVDELMARLAHNTAMAITGAVNRHKRTSRPRHRDIHWPRTIAANLRNYRSDHGTVIPEKLVGYARHSRRTDLDDVILCVDQSGSMATSVVYSSIFAAVMASLPAISTRLVAFDTAVADLTDKLADPVDVLFGIQLGGGTDINQALAYCHSIVRQPLKTHLVLISDLYEGGDSGQLFARAVDIVASGINVIVLLALSDDGRPAYDDKAARHFASLGVPVMACTPDRFPDLMAAALRKDDIQAWAAERDISLIREG